MKQQLKSMAIALPLTIFLIAAADLPYESPATGRIAGTVVDKSTNEPLPGATVVVAGTRFGAAANDEGEYLIDNVPVGSYSIVASYVGYEDLVYEDVEVNEGYTRELNFALGEDAASSDEPVVDYDQPLIQKDAVGIPRVTTEAEYVTPMAPADRGYNPPPNFNTEEYSLIVENDFKSAFANPLSTFSIDVDAGSYSNVRRFITSGQEPPVDAVRIEEMINYFSYDYPEPREGEAFSVITELGVAPWNTDHELLHIGLQGKRLRSDEQPAGNLVFLLDVSGSMQPENKLPLLKRAFRMLVEEIDEDDRVAIVVYAGSSGLVLPSTNGSDKEAILYAIDRLEAGGSTAGAAGIRLAYQVAEENFIEGGNNRVILATDGDFNVGVSSTSELIRMIEEKREQGTFLTVLGFGTGNLKDGRMEQIANHGNGNYYYIDNLMEARKVLVNEMQSTLFTIAKDVKIQIEFNPAFVESYRLIGYENRLLAAEDFDDDTKDAGELGAGHTVTALYEIIPASRKSISDTGNGGGLRYQQSGLTTDALASGELMTLSLRYKHPDGDTSSLISHQVPAELPDTMTDDFLFSAAVAEFGMILRDSEFKADASLNELLSMASVSLGEDQFGYRKSFVEMVQRYAQIVDDDVTAIMD